ncbi:aminotransferase class IV [Marisediminicola sp. LYQ134]|uniref:aminotransferase class IV n=1 Tax=Marisediminicola sp. LYQ134 TaxID=3391061 RepID=UPI00398354DA
MVADRDVARRTFSWSSGELVEQADDAPDTPTAAWPVVAADSWLVSDGAVAAIAVHRARFDAAVAAATGPGAGPDLDLDLDAFWGAVIDRVPLEGDWFPRVELRDTGGGLLARFILRPAPDRALSVTVATHLGHDPRSTPTVKGPDLEALAAARDAGRARGAEEIVLLSPEGLVVEGGYSSLLWWRGDTLCVPPADLERIPSVTEASILALAAALGVEVIHDPATPADLDGLEIWAVNALHGIRIVASWVDGPSPAELPGRLALWRARLGRLSRPIGTVAA